MAVTLVLFAVLAFFVSSDDSTFNLGKKATVVGDLTLQTKSIKYIPSLVRCIPPTDKNLDIRWVKSYLVPSFSNLSQEEINKIKADHSDATGLLVLESRIQLMSKTGSKSVNLSDFFRLNKDGKFTEPLITGKTEIQAGDPVAAYVYIPVNTQTGSYNVEFCNFDSGTATMELNFSSEAVKIEQGNFCVNQGFVTIK